MQTSAPSTLSGNPLLRRWPWVVAVFALVLTGISCALAVANWPFTDDKLMAALENRSARTVTMERYRTTYFPPGCIAEGVNFLRIQHPDRQPVIRIQKLVVRARWADLLTFQRKIADVDVYGMHLLIPPRGPAADGKTHSLIPLNSPASAQKVSITNLYVHGAALDFMPSLPGKRSFHLDVRELKLSVIGDEKPFRYEAVIENSLPKGEVHATGSFGPWSPDEPGSTPLDGVFDYTNVQLNTIPGVKGVLSAQGKLAGTLDRIGVEGTLNVPNFQVVQSSHTENLKSQFAVVVDATNGNTILKNVSATFGHTTVAVAGTVTHQPEHGGVLATIRAMVPAGRTEDLLKMFSAAKESPLSGRISLRANISVHSGKTTFLERLEMIGDFVSTGDTYNNPATQDAIDRLTKSAHGESKREEDRDPTTIPSQLKGHVALKGGVARVSNLLLSAPQTHARMDGTYNLVTEEVDLAGTLQTQGKLADTQRGFRSFALKVLTPFLKKHGSTVVPFEIKGKYGDVSTRLDLDGKRKL